MAIKVLGFKMKMHKKGQMSGAISNLLTLGIGIMVLGIALAFGLDVMTDIKADFTASSLEANATEDAMTGIANITSKTPTISKVGVAVVIIGLIVAGFGVYFMKQ